MMVNGILGIKNTNLFELNDGVKSRTVSHNVLVLNGFGIVRRMCVSSWICTFTIWMCVVFYSGNDPGFKGGLRRNPYLGHHTQHPDRTADLSTCDLNFMEGNITTVRLFFQTIFTSSNCRVFTCAIITCCHLWQHTDAEHDISHELCL